MNMNIFHVPWAQLKRGSSESVSWEEHTRKVANDELQRLSGSSGDPAYQALVFLPLFLNKKLCARTYRHCVYECQCREMELSKQWSAKWRLSLTDGLLSDPWLCPLTQLGTLDGRFAGKVPTSSNRSRFVENERVERLDSLSWWVQIRRMLQYSLCCVDRRLVPGNIAREVSSETVFQAATSLKDRKLVCLTPC